MKVCLHVSVILLYLCATALSIGLQEEFTWSRISYAWPRGRNRRYGSSGGGYHTHFQPINNGYDGIAFPDSVSRPHRGAYGGQRRPSDGYQLGDYSGRRPAREQIDSSGNGAPSNIDYNYEVNIPMGTNRWKDKLFITVPRRRLGVPSSLNYVSLSSSERHNAPLIPYPDWETNLLPTGNEGNDQNRVKITSVYRVAVDPCDRLWVIDTGNLEIPGNATRIQPSQLVIFDLNTDRIIQRHEFPQSNVRENTNLALVTVDVTKDTCGDAFGYLPDVGGYGLIVYSFRENRSWRINHNYFFLEPLRGDFSIGGYEFQWNDGIFSIALSDIKSDGYRDAYFHSMAGTNQYKVSTKVLKNETLATRSYQGNDFKFIGDRGDGFQTSASDMYQPSDVLFLGLVAQNALGCWNTNRPLSEMSVIQRDDMKMIYPCDVKIYEDEIILLTNAMPVFLYGQLDYDTINFRVWMEKVSNAIEGTNCAPERRQRPTRHY